MYPSDDKLTRVITSVAAVVALAVSVILPLGYFRVVHEGLSAAVSTEAEIQAEIIGQLVRTAPDTWMFQVHRLENLLTRHPRERDIESARILDSKGNVIAAVGVAPAPALSRSMALFDAGIEVGRIEILHSLRGLLMKTALAALLGLLLGAIVLVTLRVIPLRALRSAMDALTREKERAEVTLHSIGDAVITTDADERIEYLNPVAEQLTGWSTEEAKGKPLAEIFVLVNEVTNEPVPIPLQQAIATKTIIPLSNHTALIRRDGKHIPIEDNAAPILGQDGEVLGGVLVFHDVSATRSMSKALSWQASHDTLTGLINRNEFDGRLENALRVAKTENKHHALCYIDLDQFKIVNDTCGHAAGDELLKQVSALLRSRVRGADTLGRVGGDEFAMLLVSCPLEKAHHIAGEMLDAIRKFRFRWQEKVFTVGASMGIVAITPASTSAQRILSSADTACYSAKEGGRDRIHVFRYGAEELSQRHQQMDWVSRLTSALEEDRFVLYCQPYQSLSPDASPEMHLELLLRLIDESGQIVAPGFFIPAAERYNIMPVLDRWVIKRAFNTCRAVTGKSSQNTIYAINLSGTSLSDEKFVEFVLKQAEQDGVSPGMFCFEITETSAVNQLSKAAEFIAKLRSAGFKFALDDFGVGMSSFAYLKHLPVDYLKIDGSFVKEISSDPISRTMVVAINEVGHTMGIRTIAEFVDSPEVLQELRAIGVDYAQGYLISKPYPLSEFPRLVDEQRLVAVT